MRPSALRRPLTVLAAAALLMGPLLTAPAALAEGSKDDKVAERASVDQQLEDLRIELSDVDDDLAQTYLDLAETELLIPQAQQDLDDAQAELEAARQEDQQTGDRLEAAQEEERQLSGEVDTGQQEVDSSDEELKQVAIEAYKGGGLPSPASVYLDSATPQDAVDRSMNYRLTLAFQGSRLDSLRTDQALTENSADRLTAVREEIDDLKQQSEDAVQRTEDAEQKASDAKSSLDDLYAQQTQQRDDLEAKKKQYQDQEGDLEDRGSTLDDEIAELARQEKEREQAAAASTPAPSGGDSGGSSSAKGGWIRPVDSRMNSNFGWRYHPIYHTRKLHAGVDFPVACGTPVKAAHDGRVLSTTSNHNAGNKLILSHGMSGGKVITTSYHHLQSFAVSTGQSVKAGQTVAYVGTTGSSTGCHLHFEVHEDGNAVDPAGYV
ncbi:M23 family metallopeptidase [Brachybacterium horti]